MNIYRSRNIKRTTTTKKVVKKSSAIGSVISIFAMGLSLLLLIAIFLGLYIYLDSHSQKISQEIIKMKQEMVTIDREIENNTIRIASLKSWAHVNKKIVAYDMELRLPTQQQKYHIALIDIEENNRVNSKKLSVRDTNNIRIGKR